MKQSGSCQVSNMLPYIPRPALYSRKNQKTLISHANTPEYCIKTRFCLEARPCFGEPVKMGDPFALLRATTYDVYCGTKVHIRTHVCACKDTAMHGDFPSSGSCASVIRVHPPLFPFPTTHSQTHIKHKITLPDPLNRGCKTPYVDGRPLKPGERACGYKWACDLRIPSIRLRIGYYAK